MSRAELDTWGYDDIVTLREPAWPDRSTLRWLGHQRLRNKDQLFWRRWRLGVALLRRGVHYRHPLQGNLLQMLQEGRLQIGPRSYLESSMTIRGNEGARILIGAGAEFNRNVTIGAGHLVVIGDHVLVGQGSYITDVNHVFADPDTPVEDQGFSTRGPTVIEDNCWLGANVIVTSGVRIGRCSVIGAGAVVTRSVPPYSIVRGGTSKAFPRRDLGDRRPLAEVTGEPMSEAAQDAVSAAS
ncbi:acyltransferase [Nocardioides sp. BP30]|uniref:acyltransferase n=1 Tax=Nocardioides sp. BP30 TaxID=3036374 RepID=UPI00246958A6|nr:acyltransferase [Nocardioides sp. BP30]WGL53307.1 acyltransferase [Nocardioides sp. BP30]